MSDTKWDWNYAPDKIPAWCQMPKPEHEFAGGCWGISSGEVARLGTEHCKTCEYFKVLPGATQGVE